MKTIVSALFLVLIMQSSSAQQTRPHGNLELFAGAGLGVTTAMGGSSFDKQLFSTCIPAPTFSGDVIYAHPLSRETSLQTGLGLGIIHYNFRLSTKSDKANDQFFRGTVSCLDAKMPIYTKFAIAEGKKNSKYYLTAGAELHAINIFSQGFTASSDWEETNFEVAEGEHMEFAISARCGIEGNQFGNGSKIGWYVLANYQFTPVAEMLLSATDNNGISASGVLAPGSLMLTAGIHIPLIN